VKDVCELMNLAADHIEQHPEQYNFTAGDVHRGGSPQCMLTRMGNIAGMREGTNCDSVSQELLGVDHHSFYAQISATAGMRWGPVVSSCMESECVTLVNDPARVPAAMRALAPQYRGIPIAVRDFFKQTEVA
jgi:hypothetical protein